MARLPLAEAAYRLLDYVTHEEFLEEIFEEYRGRSYTKVIRFPLFVRLIADALLEHRGSGHKSFSRAQEAGTLEASLKAAYGKLARVPLSLSEGLLLQAGRRLRELYPATATVALPKSLDGMAVLALDGKKIKHLAHRLKVLRRVHSHVLAAKLVAAMDLRSGLVLAIAGHPDGEVSDAPLVPGVLTQVRACTAGPRLWVEDRQFCDLTQPHLALAGGDHYLIRYNAKVSFTQDPQQPVRRGEDEAGREYQEEWGWLGSAKDARRQYVRRITLFRPDEEDVILVTDLTDADLHPALDLLQVYLERWGIERVFQRITEVFHLRTLIGSTPQAGVFQAAFCMLLYNVIAVLRGYIAEARRREPESISTENLFDDVRRDLSALHEVLSVPEVVALFEERLPGKELRQRLGALLAGQWSTCWLKAPSRKPKPSPGHKEYIKGGHTSVYRLLQRAKASAKMVSPPPRK